MINNRRKEVTFDLILDELKNKFGDTNFSKGYEQLNDFFVNKRNFEHRQGSVYCSSYPMSPIEVINLVGELRKICPWLETCLKRMDVANIENLHEVTNIIIN